MTFSSESERKILKNCFFDYCKSRKYQTFEIEKIWDKGVSKDDVVISSEKLDHMSTVIYRCFRSNHKEGDYYGSALGYEDAIFSLFIQEHEAI